MVEYSAGYIAKVKDKLRELDQTFSQKANRLADDLSVAFEKSATRQPPSDPPTGKQS